MNLTDLFLMPTTAQEYVLLVVRIAVAIAAGLVGWFLTPPLISIFHRAMFRKPASRYVRGIGRLLGTAIMALLAFYLLTLGLGGLGMLGGGAGSGNQVGKGDGSTQNKTNQTNKKNQDDPSPRPKEVLTIEIIAAKDYQVFSGQAYLWGEKKKPKSLPDVHKLLDENPTKWGRLDIIIYPESLASQHSTVQQLQKLAEDRQIVAAIVRKSSK